MLRNFVENGNAADIYHLQEIGIPIADSQQELTPFQRQVLVREKIRQNKKEQEQMDTGGNSPRKIKGTPNAKSGRIQAIEESQKERERYINTSVVDRE